MEWSRRTEVAPGLALAVEEIQQAVTPPSYTIIAVRGAK